MLGEEKDWNVRKVKDEIGKEDKIGQKKGKKIGKRKENDGIEMLGEEKGI